MSLRDELAAIYAEDDKLRAEHAAWLAAREPQAVAAEDADGSIRRAVVRKFGNDAVLYREHDENTPAPAAQPVQTISEGWEGWERWMRGHLANERAEVT